MPRNQSRTLELQHNGSDKEVCISQVRLVACGGLVVPSLSLATQYGNCWSHNLSHAHPNHSIRRSTH
ncbi:hypothetical protein SARC_07088, partial [Sphaeroforma arctica JP610]